MIFRLFLYGGLILWIGSLSGQINESDTLKCQTLAALTGKYQTGNVNLLQVRGNLIFSTYLGQDLVFKTQNKTLYQEFSGRKVDNDLESRNFLYFRPQQRVYPIALLFVSTNFRRSISSTTFGGLGVTWQAIGNFDKNHNLKLSLSFLQETTRFRGREFNIPAYDGRTTVETTRMALYLHGFHRWKEGKVLLHYDGFWEPSLEDSMNYRLILDAGLDLKMWRFVYLRGAYRYSHENLIIAGGVPGDSILSFGLSFRWQSS